VPLGAIPDVRLNSIRSRLELKNMQILFGEILSEIVSHQPACNNVFSDCLLARMRQNQNIGSDTHTAL
jgi:hypothetical protein